MLTMVISICAWFLGITIKIPVLFTTTIENKSQKKIARAHQHRHLWASLVTTQPAHIALLVQSEKHVIWKVTLEVRVAPNRCLLPCLVVWGVLIPMDTTAGWESTVPRGPTVHIMYARNDSTRRNIHQYIFIRIIELKNGLKLRTIAKTRKRWYTLSWWAPCRIQLSCVEFLNENRVNFWFSSIVFPHGRLGDFNVWKLFFNRDLGGLIGVCISLWFWSRNPNWLNNIPN